LGNKWLSTEELQRFQDKYNDFGAVDEWLTTEGNRVILVVDELNIIHHTAGRYGAMSRLLDNFLQQKGCVFLYSTHERGTADHLRGRPASWFGKSSNTFKAPT
jgi:hypothetical protein